MEKQNSRPFQLTILKQIQAVKQLLIRGINILSVHSFAKNRLLPENVKAVIFQILY